MFVMQHFQLAWEDALHMVQNRRYCISPNGGFLTQIKVSGGRLQLILGCGLVLKIDVFPTFCVGV